MVVMYDTTSKERKARMSGKRWWSYDNSEVAGCIRNDIDRLSKSFSQHFTNYAINASTYYGGAVDGLYGSRRYGFTLKNTQLTDNVTESCVDALVSKMVKNFPSVSFQTEDGDYETQTMAETLQDFVHGVFYSDSYVKKASDKLAETAVFGNGFLIWRLHNNRLCSEVIHPFQLICDYDETLTGPPEYIHIPMLRNKYLLAEEYPEYRQEIIVASYDTNLFWYLLNKNAAVDSDLCVVIESYSRAGRRRTITVSTTCLLDEVWDMTGRDGEVIFPLTNQSYKPSLGWMSQGMVQEVRSLQWEYDRVLRDISRIVYMGCVPKILVGSQAKIPKMALNNDYFTIIPVNGPLDQIMPMTLASVPPDMIRHKNDLKEAIFQKSGVSQLTATNQLPPGVTSGTAIENLWQVDSDRFQMTAKGLEESVLADCDVIIRMARWLYETKNIDVQTTYFGEGKFSGRKINWSDAPLDEDQYQLQVFPVSMMPQTPAGRLSFVNDLAQGGYTDLSTIKRLLRLPDTDMYLDLETSEYDYVNRQITNMLKGEPEEPNDLQNLDLAMDQVKKAYFYYTNRGVDKDNMVNLVQYMDAIDQIQNQKAMDQQLIMQQQQQQIQQQAIQQGAAYDGNKPSFNTGTGAGYGRRPTKQSIGTATNTGPISGPAVQ